MDKWSDVCKWSALWNQVWKRANIEIFFGGGGGGGGGGGRGGGSTKHCDHDSDQGLIKTSWGSVLSIHILLSSCFGYIGVSLWM